MKQAGCGEDGEKGVYWEVKRSLQGVGRMGRGVCTGRSQEACRVWDGERGVYWEVKRSLQGVGRMGRGVYWKIKSSLQDVGRMGRGVCTGKSREACRVWGGWGDGCTGRSKETCRVWGGWGEGCVLGGQEKPAGCGEDGERGVYREVKGSLQGVGRIGRGVCTGRSREACRVWGGLGEGCVLGGQEKPAGCGEDGERGVYWEVKRSLQGVGRMGRGVCTGRSREACRVWGGWGEGCVLGGHKKPAGCGMGRGGCVLGGQERPAGCGEDGERGVYWEVKRSLQGVGKMGRGVYWEIKRSLQDVGGWGEGCVLGSQEKPAGCGEDGETGVLGGQKKPAGCGEDGERGVYWEVKRSLQGVGRMGRGVCTGRSREACRVWGGSGEGCVLGGQEKHAGCGEDWERGVYWEVKRSLQGVGRMGRGVCTGRSREACRVWGGWGEGCVLGGQEKSARCGEDGERGVYWEVKGSLQVVGRMGRGVCTGRSQEACRVCGGWGEGGVLGGQEKPAGCGEDGERGVLGDQEKPAGCGEDGERGVYWEVKRNLQGVWRMGRGVYWEIKRSLQGVGRMGKGVCWEVTRSLQVVGRTGRGGVLGGQESPAGCGEDGERGAYWEIT